MKYYSKFLLVIALLVFTAFSLQAQDRFDRSATFLPDDTLNVGGFGNIVAGVDFDNDGMLEIYFVNNNWKDDPTGDQIPRIYKYEMNDQGGWDLVWHTVLDLNPDPIFYMIQNTWPPLAAADLDNDGKMEIVWGPVNFPNAANPNPARIVVFETPGDGSDNMGIDNGDGTWRPNAFWTITDLNDQNIRPFKWIIADVDGDNTDEIVTALRAGDQRGAIYSVDNVPDTGDSTETWTIEWEGLGANTQYDLAIIGTNMYFIRSNGNVTKVYWSSDSSKYLADAPQAGLVPDGAWNCASTVDIDNDGTDEIIVADWSSNKGVWLLQESGDTLLATQIADLSNYTEFRWFNGGNAGDIDGDGLMDYVMGTRDYDTPGGDENIIMRLEYQGGDITSPANYEASMIDKNVIAPQGSQMDVVVVANVDDDGEDEVLYTGVTRPYASGGPPVPPVSLLELIPDNQPIIAATADVPNDQGRQVWVIWQAAADDVPIVQNLNSSAQVAIFGPEDAEFPRMTVNGITLEPVRINEAPALTEEDIMNYVVWRIDAGLYPVQVATATAVQFPFYAAVVPTLGDGAEYAGTFVVSSHTPDPYVNWKSFPRTGESVDNLVPTAPTNVLANVVNSDVELTWDESPDPDFNYFSIRRGDQPGFDPTNPATEVGTTTDPFFVDQALQTGTYFYRVVAYDFNGNLGNFSDEVSVPLSIDKNGDNLPKTFALHQNYPNPFNPETYIAFDVPRAVDVQIVIYNTLGQKVKTLVNESTAPGSYKVLWDGTNDQGARVASGLYIYTIKAGEFVKSRKMTLMR